MHIVNRTYDQLQPGDTAELKRLITADDLAVFAASSGNLNPMDLSDHPARIAPGMFVASMISALLGTELPGPGTFYRRQEMDFQGLAHAGDELTARVEVLEKRADGTVRLSTTVRRQDGVTVISGEAVVLAPTEAFSADLEVPGLIVQRHRHFEALVARARALPPLPTAVVCAHDPNSLGGALLAAAEGIITPILIGREAAIRATAAEIDQDLTGIEILDVARDLDAAARACALVHEGRARAVMKGHLHTDDLLKPMLDKALGLRIGRRFTHVFVMDVPGLPEPLLVTDAAINIAPDLPTKVDICQNAIDLARAIGMDPRVGVLSAVETVNPAIQSSIDAALLSKMAERGQITGGLVEGPLAMDNAVDMGAARTKGLKGLVAGRANILVVPGLDAGNMLAKQLAFISHAEGAGLVLGARVPVILNSRSDSPMSRLASCAVAALAGGAGMKAILTLNAGSSSMKAALYPAEGDAPLATGQADRIGPEGTLRMKLPQQVERQGITSHAEALAQMLGVLRQEWPALDLLAIGHRVVHGGLREAPAPVTPEVLAELEGLCDFAPLHQPHNLGAIRAAAEAFPGVPQVACFDTAFHRAHPWVADTFALPRRFYDEGVRRYGFHGLSYDYIAGILPEGLNRVVVAHLGNGASMCALRAGRPVASTMGFSALDGLPMGTRSGQIDPGVLLYLMNRGMDAAALSDLLYRQSGLLGLSGISNDMRTLEASQASEAAEAIAYFTFRCRREVAAMAAAMEGIDALVFTGGIGENSAHVRREICEPLAWMGIGTSVPVLVLPTNEELVIARAARALVGSMT